MGKLNSLLKYAKKYKKRYFVGIVFLIIVDFIQLAPPKILGYLTDSLAQGTATKWKITVAVVSILLIAAIMATCRFMWRIYINGTARYVEYDIRSKFFKHLQSLSTNYYNKNKTGDLMALATNDLNAVRMALGQGVIMFCDAVVLTIATLIIMLSINTKLTLISLIPLPFVAIISRRFGRSIHKKFTRVQSCFSKLTDVVQENFSGIRIVKSFVQEEKEYEKFLEENQNNLNANMDFIRVWGIFSPLIELIASLSFVILIAIGGRFVILGNISLGEFITFNMYLGNLVWPMMAMGWVINNLQRGYASLERIEEVLNTQPEILDKYVDKIESLNGDIVIKDLTFAYPDTDLAALKDINITIKKGETLGIVGRTGSSKTTLINLLLRLYNVENGKILINGKDINKIPLDTLRHNIGFVSQDPFLFSTTLAENINLAYNELNMDKVIEATRNADVYDNIMDFPEGFDTMVGERGVTLSGGQKQRASIARALIKNPDILILDDCLSAVDAKTEVKILDNLKKIMKDKTSIIISHRISAVKEANQIIVLEQGKIAQKGTHEQLKNQEGIYREIYEKQQIEQAIMAEGEV
ncbi:ABC transporter ATP-binding protein [Clostridium sp. UBA4548]|uniref:ABC transporter ATP-binding protein n=1 Tax=Clostridium sp. UBA4548 TaxID=1946361 RepID=UPI0025C73F84|nr:ABC transporter ATP-binding protein [Clostridium sp. UBA4548]